MTTATRPARWTCWTTLRVAHNPTGPTTAVNSCATYCGQNNALATGVGMASTVFARPQLDPQSVCTFASPLPARQRFGRFAQPHERQIAVGPLDHARAAARRARAGSPNVSPRVLGSGGPAACRSPARVPRCRHGFHRPCTTGAGSAMASASMPITGPSAKVSAWLSTALARPELDPQSVCTFASPLPDSPALWALLLNRCPCTGRRRPRVRTGPPPCRGRRNSHGRMDHPKKSLARVRLTNR